MYAAQGREPRNKLRFMWFGAEEFNLLGSAAYVASLSQAERDQIEVMLNFDMVGSPNYVRFVYDGDGSATSPAGPAGSAFVEDVFADYFNSQGLAFEPTQFSGRSDYGPFIAVGIPAGGLFTGAEGLKTATQAAIYGGTAGAQYDPCYHLACDTLAGTGSGAGATAPGLALKALDEMSDAAAHAILFFSRTKVDVAQTAAIARGALGELELGPGRLRRPRARRRVADARSEGAGEAPAPSLFPPILARDGPRGRPGADRSRRDGQRHGERHPRDGACGRDVASTSAPSRSRTGAAPGSRWTATVGRVRDRREVRDAVSIAALCEVAEEAAFPGDLDELRSQLVALRISEAPEGIEEAEQAARDLQHVLGAPPHLATAARLDEIGYAARRLEQALDPTAPSPFTSTMRSAAAVADALWDDVQAAYRGSLDG